MDLLERMRECNELSWGGGEDLLPPMVCRFIGLPVSLDSVSAASRSRVARRLR